jgi:hypothetical protein
MKQRPRIYYSASQRALIWDRWRKGETIHQIAGLFDRYHHRYSAFWLSPAGYSQPSSSVRDGH